MVGGRRPLHDAVSAYGGEGRELDKNTESPAVQYDEVEEEGTEATVMGMTRRCVNRRPRIVPCRRKTVLEFTKSLRAVV